MSSVYLVYFIYMATEISRHRITLSLVSIVRSVFALGELVIMVRILLDFLKASDEAVFVQFVNRITDPLLFPFLGTFPPYELQSGFVIQTYAALAFVVYALLGYLVVQGIMILGSHRSLFRKRTDY